MRATIDCVLCLFKQALSASQLITSDEGKQLEVIKELMRELQDIEYPLERTPAEYSYDALQIAYRLLDSRDPFAEAKRKHNQIAMELYPKLREIVENSKDRLHTAAKLAVAGNIIDLGVFKESEFDLEETIQHALEAGFAIDHFPKFRERLSECSKLLYILDNAGEIVFDRLFIEELQKELEVVGVVKGGPILNDATWDDAKQTGLDKVARVIDNGSDMVGTVLELCSEEFRQEFNEADIIISKGQGNYETLDEEDKDIFFILKAKCETIARNLGVELGDVVFKRSDHRSN